MMTKKRTNLILRQMTWFGALAWLVPTGLLAAVNWEAVVLDGPRPNAQADELIVIYKDGSVRAPAAALPQGRAAIGRQTWQPPASAAALHARVGARGVQGFNRVHGEQVRLPLGGGLAGMRAAAAVYEADPDVLVAEPNYVYYTTVEPNDPMYGITNVVDQTGGLWGLREIGAPEAWDVTTGSRDIVVAVIDTGISNAEGHGDLDDNLWDNPGEFGVRMTDFGRDADWAADGLDNDGNGYIDDVRGWNSVLWNNSVYDGDGHGTHCAGTIGAVGNNNYGVVGVNWEVSLMGVKGLTDTGSGDTFMLARAIEYVSWFDGREGRPRVHVVNNSWGGVGNSTAILQAIEKTREAGQLFVVAAGNSNRNIDNNPDYPASYMVDNMLTVAAVALNDNMGSAPGDTNRLIKASFSNFGSNTVHVAAPGQGILSTMPRNPLLVGVETPGTVGFDFQYMDGTSMAAPHVSGAAALLFAYAPEADYQMVKDALMYSAEQNLVPSFNNRVRTGGMIYLPDALAYMAVQLQIAPRDEVTRAFGPLGGPFTGLPVEFDLRNPMTGGIDGHASIGVNVAVSFGTDAPWLDVWWRGVNEGQTFGDTLAMGESMKLEMRPNAATLELPYGTYTADVLVTDDSGVRVFMVELRVSENYALQSAPYQWLEPTAGAVQVTAFETQKIAIPFGFEYYGEVYSNLWVSANGMIGLTPAFPRVGVCELPAGSATAPLIMPYWDRLEARVEANSSVTTEYFTSPSRFVVTWRNMVLRGTTDTTTPTLDFQVVLFGGSSTSGSGDIQFNYRATAQNNLRGGARMAAVGVQDGFGAKAYSVRGFAPEREFLPPRLVPQGEPMQVADGQSLLFTWHSMLPDTQKPSVADIKNILFMPGNLNMVSGFEDGVAKFEVRFNEVVMNLRAEDFEFSADTMAGAHITHISGGGERFVITVEGLEQFGCVRIRLKGHAVEDLAGNWNNEMPEFATAVAPYTRMYLADDFESGVGFWTVSTNTYNFVTTAGWEHGVPAMPPAYADGPWAAYSGASCWGTFLAANCTPGMNAWLRSQEIYLDSSPILDFRYWMSLGGQDKAYLEISTGGGYEIVFDLTQYAQNVAGGEWNHFSQELPEKFKNKNVRIQFRVTTALLDTSARAGLYIDNFQVLNLQEPGLWLVSATPQPLDTGSTINLTAFVYNSTPNTVGYAGGVFGCPDPAVTVLTKGMQYYGEIQPGEIIAFESVVVQTAANAADYRMNQIPLTHNAFDAGVWMTANEIPLLVDVTPAAQTKTMRAYTTGRVTDWRGRSLKGDGGPGAPLYQLIYAGANGVPDAPAADGSPTGDDVVLYTSVEFNAFGRFGAIKVPANEEQFDRVFVHALASGGKLFVRAWNAASFDAAQAYGDSNLYTLNANTSQSYDFGSWAVNQPSQPSRDSNGDGIPDGYAIGLGLDPLESNNAFEPHFELQQKTPNMGTPPRRAVANDKFVFSAHPSYGGINNGQIQVWTRDLSTCVATYSSVSVAGTSYVINPTSLCLNEDGTALYVVTQGTPSQTTLSSRILMFHINPVTGLLSATSGGGTASGQTLPAVKVFPAMSTIISPPVNPAPFQNIWDIALESDGSVYVVDGATVIMDGLRCYRVHNVTIAEATPVYAVEFYLWEGDLNYKQPCSITLDAGNIYVGTLDAGNAAVLRIEKFGSYFYYHATHLSAANGLAMGLAGYTYAMEKNRNRLSIYPPGFAQPYATYTTPDPTTPPSVALNAPEGVFIDKTSPFHRVLVADSGNNRLVWLRLYVDVDEDGIDDHWESYYFDDPAACDPWDDPDNDGLANIGEYRVGTNPLDPDTNGNGATDLWDLNEGNDPADPNAPSPSFQLPSVVSVTASTNVIYAGESVVLTVTFNRAVTGKPAGANPGIKFLTTGDGITAGYFALNGGASVYTFTFTAASTSAAGPVDVIINNAFNADNPGKSASMDPNPQTFMDVFEIAVLEPEIPDDPDPPAHTGLLQITEFHTDPLYIKWTAQPDVQYWIITSTNLSAVAWDYLYLSESPFIGQPLPADSLDKTDALFDYADLTRFFRITTDPPATP